MASESIFQISIFCSRNRICVYLITSKVSRPLREIIQVILNQKLPETIPDLRTFLGLIEFYRYNLKGVAKNQAILHEYRSKKQDIENIYWAAEAI